MAETLMNIHSNSVITKYRMKPLKLNVERLGRNLVLIEGNKRALEFLGELILAHASNRTKDCGIQIEPHGAVGKLFAKRSKLGLYVHLLGTGCTKDKKLK